MDKLEKFKLVNDTSKGAVNCIVDFMDNKITSQFSSSTSSSEDEEKIKTMMMCFQATSLRLLALSLTSLMEFGGNTKIANALKKEIIDNWKEWTGEEF